MLLSFFDLSFFDDLDFLDGIVIALAGADPQCGFNGDNENLAVTDAAGLCGCGDSLYYAVGEAVLDYDFQFYLGQKVDDIFGTTIEFGMAFLAAKALGFGNGDSRNTNLVQSFFYFVEFEWLDDRFDLFHGFPLYGAGISKSALSDYAIALSSIVPDEMRGFAGFMG
jgi:hypothetical protein